MSLDPSRPDTQPLTTLEQCLAYFRTAERPAHEHKVGLEHEKFVYPLEAPQAVPYEGPRGIRALFERLEPHGFTAFREAPDRPAIALQRGAATLSLEPGGQLELSGSPFPTAREAHQENLAHLAEVRAVAAGLGLHLVALGYRPFDLRDAMPWMPKTRYQAMRQALPERGRLALNMMLMTATAQVSLDWADEADCARKVSATARLSPLLVALYANSPLAEGRPTGYLSFRSRVWDEVDPTRCGYLPSMLDGSFSYRAYAEWALDAPLLFLRRRGEYLRPRMTFRQLMREGFEGEPASQGDWADHLSTLFPEVRIKKVLEVRAADSAGAAQTGALAALWRGLLYDAQALSEAERLLPALSFPEHLAFHEEARVHGLRGRLRGRELHRLAGEMVEIARRGLLRLDPADAPLLEPLAEVAASGRSPAEHVLEAFAQDPRPEALLGRFTL